MTALVGPVLRMGGEVEHVIAAIKDDNPDLELVVVDSGAYVRVQGPGEIRLTQESLRRHLGPQYEIRSFGSIMPAFTGRVVTTSDSITWRNHAPTRQPDR